MRTLVSRSLGCFTWIVLAGAAPALGVEFAVNTTDDGADAALDGTCADAEGRCTLRAAVQEANANPLDADTIQLPAGVYGLKLAGALEDGAASGDLDVTGPLTIQGEDTATTIIRGKKDRVLDVFADGVIVADLTITKGKSPKSDVGGEASGGGIRNAGALELQRVVVTRNRAADDAGGIANDGGTLTLVDSTVSRNKATDDAGGMDNDGGTVTLNGVTFHKNKTKDEAGAFESEQGGTLVGTNVTVSGNKALEAGGVNAEQGGSIDLFNATLTGNKSKLGGNGVQVEDDGSAVAIQNTIVARNGKLDCSGPIESLGGNLDGDGSCGLAAPDDRPSVDPALEKKIADNGGPTETHALLPGSPAIDFAVDAACPPNDQRGTARVDDPAVEGDGCDSGAFELAPPAP